MVAPSTEMDAQNNVSMKAGPDARGSDIAVGESGDSVWIDRRDKAVRRGWSTVVLTPRTTSAVCTCSNAKIPIGPSCDGHY